VNRYRGRVEPALVDAAGIAGRYFGVALGPTGLPNAPHNDGLLDRGQCDWPAFAFTCKIRLVCKRDSLSDIAQEEESHERAGLDHRHRDKNGEISRKHGNTLVRTLRKLYGAGFAPGCSDKTS
jgi:hypothetical protein